MSVPKAQFPQSLCLGFTAALKQQYSFEIKKEVVQRHLSGETAMNLAREFGLSSEKLVSGWSRKWRNGGVTERVEWIAPVKVYAGDFEMDALASGAIRAQHLGRPR